MKYIATIRGAKIYKKDKNYYKVYEEKSGYTNWKKVIDIFHCSNGPEYEAICKVFDKKIINEIMEELKK